MRQRVPERVPLAGQRRVDQHDAGHRGRRELVAADLPGSGRPAQPAVEHRQHDEGQPEGRRGDAGERNGARQVVDPGIALHRGQHAQRQAEQQRQQERDGGEFDGGGGVLRDVLDHRALRGDRDAEIAVRQATEKNPVAVPHRQIEAPFVPVSLDDCRIVGGDVAKLGQHRVARHRVGDQEDDQRGQQHHRRGNHKTRGDVAQQAMVSLPGAAHTAWAGRRQASGATLYCAVRPV